MRKRTYWPPIVERNRWEQEKDVRDDAAAAATLTAHWCSGCPSGKWWLGIDALGAPHVGERSEKQLISSFVDRIAELSPQLVTFNGSSFDLPVLRSVQ
jgi:hypothetical protein